MEWRTLKQSLITKAELHPLFKEDVDSTIKERMSKWEQDKNSKDLKLRYEPLLIETILKNLSELLDRVLGYRKEARELEVLAVKAASEYDLFLQQHAIEQKLEVLKLRTTQKKIFVKGFSDSAQNFGNSEDVTKGLQSTLTTLSNSYDQELKDIEDETNLLKEKWSVLEGFYLAYHNRHRDPGNAHNYSERAERIYELLGEDLSECYQMAISLSTGLEMIYGKKIIDLPHPSEASFIDNLVKWCRNQIYEYEARSDDEIEYDCIIPLVQPTAPLNKSLVSAQDFDKAVKQAVGNEIKLVFTLPSEVFFSDEFVRVKSIGLCYGSKPQILSASGTDLNATFESYARLRASILTPIQTLPDGTTYHRPPIRMGNVGVFSAGVPLAHVSGQNCQNINPVGEWIITIDQLAIYKDRDILKASIGVEGRPMLDLKLFLKIRSKPLKSV